MSFSNIGWRKAAEQDVEAAILYYVLNASFEISINFLDALERAVDQIKRQPNIGSLRYAHELDMAGLRSWGVKDFPYLIFYINQPNQVTVYRVLHSQRDIPSELRE